MIGVEGSPLAAPRVQVVGSASFSLSWADLTGPCRQQTKTRVSYRSSGNHNATSWQVLTTMASGSTFLAYPLRCPTGCAFRVESGRGDERWTAPSATTAVVRNAPLPELSPGHVRLELRLQSEQPDKDTLQMSLDAADDVASALRLEDSSAVTVHEVYGAGRYIVLDVRSAVQDGARESTAASSLAQQLALMAQAPKDDVWGLRASVTTGEVDGVNMLVDGSSVWTTVHVGSEARERLGRLSKWYGDRSDAGGGDSVFDEARHLVTAMVAIALVLWCCCRGPSTGGYSVVDGSEQ